MAILRLMGPADTVTKELLGLNAGQIDMPDLIGLIGQWNAVLLFGVVG
jgi:hypothetical protein